MNNIDAGKETLRPPSTNRDEQFINTIWRGIAEAIAAEVALLRREGYPVWILRDGKVVDASQDPEAAPENP